MRRRCHEHYPVLRFTAAINKKFPLILKIVAKIDDTVPSSPHGHFIDQNGKAIDNVKLVMVCVCVGRGGGREGSFVTS